MMKRRVSLLGSTGSVGTNALNIVRDHPTRYRIVSLSAGSSVDVLAQQILEFRPDYASVGSEDAARSLRKALPADLGVKVFFGVEGHRLCVEQSNPDVVLSAMMGTFGLK